MPAPESALPAPFGRYTLLERVGGGGMATVYRASLTGEGGFAKELAVKVVRPELAEEPQFVEMFLDEARLSARLSHANVVQTFDFGQVDGVWFLAMEYVRGLTLAGMQRIGRTRRIALGVPRSLHVVGEVARGLGYAHRLRDGGGTPLGLVHRDISPQNVLISREGDVKLADFGIAKAAWRSTVTRPGHVRGKCAYMAPEQARGLELDARTDVFALGVLLWECLAGRPLFDGASDGAVLLQVVQREIAPPSRLAPDVPPEVDALVLRMLARDPALRPVNGDEVAREIAELKLRIVRSSAEIDLAKYLRELGTETAVLPAVGQGGPPPPPTPRGTEEPQSIVLESSELEMEPPAWMDPEAPTIVPAAVRERVMGTGTGARTVAARGAAASVGEHGPVRGTPGRRIPAVGAALIAAGLLTVAGGVWWGARVAAPSTAVAAPVTASTADSSAPEAAELGPAAATISHDAAAFDAVAGSPATADADEGTAAGATGAGSVNPGHGLVAPAIEELRASEGNGGGEVTTGETVAAKLGEPFLREQRDPAGGTPTATATGDGHEEVAASPKATAPDHTSKRMGSTRFVASALGQHVAPARAEATTPATPRKRKQDASPKTAPSLPLAASSANAESDQETGELVITSKLAAGVDVAVDGRSIGKLGRWQRSSLTVPAGVHRVRFVVEHGKTRCIAKTKVPPLGKKTLLIDPGGIFELVGEDRLPVDCLAE